MCRVPLLFFLLFSPFFCPGFLFSHFVDPPRWARRDAATGCRQCNAQLTEKKTAHCRLCGELFCHACTRKHRLPPRFEKKGKRGPVRVCTACVDRVVEQHRKRSTQLIPSVSVHWANGTTNMHNYGKDDGSTGAVYTLTNVPAGMNAVDLFAAVADALKPALFQFMYNGVPVAEQLLPAFQAHQFGANIFICPSILSTSSSLSYSGSSQPRRSISAAPKPNPRDSVCEPGLSTAAASVSIISSSMSATPAAAQEVILTATPAASTTTTLDPSASAASGVAVIAAQASPQDADKTTDAEAREKKAAKKTAVWAQAKFTYVNKKPGPNYLSFAKGDLLKVTNTSSEHWWWAISADKSAKGWIPSSYVVILQNKK